MHPRLAESSYEEVVKRIEDKSSYEGDRKRENTITQSNSQQHLNIANPAINGTFSTGFAIQPIHPRVPKFDGSAISSNEKETMKFAYAKAKSMKSADVILFGVPDESGSHALRKGAKQGPDAIRKISNREAKVSKTSTYEAQEGPIHASVFDAGNKTKKTIASLVEKAQRQGKKTIIFGGDHSITFNAIKGVVKVHKNISVIYLDTHPDFICSRGSYFGSVLCDISHLKNVNLKKSALIGIRAIEPEERKTIKKSGIKAYTTLDIYDKGIKQVAKQLKKLIGKNKVYISIDLDVFDPDVAPGVSTPYPGGLQTLDVIYLIKAIAKHAVGFDIMEYTPKYDIQERTGHVATVLTLELLKQVNE